jgi:hypothetical protein
MADEEELAEAGGGALDKRAEKSFTREQLYDLVWKEPMLRVGERLGVSSSYMARVCTELRVPRPAPGYWAQVEFGKTPDRPPLPDARPGDVTEWSPGAALGTIERAVGRQARAAASAAQGTTAPVDRPVTPRRRAAGTEKTHPLVVGLKPLFEKTRASDTGILRPFKRLMVDVMSSKENLDVAISAADKLFLALAAHGHRVTIAPAGVQMRRADVDLREVSRKNHYQQVTWSPERPTVVYIGDVAIGLTLFEMTQATEMQYIGSSTYVPVSSLSQTQLRRYEQARYWTSTQDKASGRLRLQAYCPSWRVAWVKHWSEAKPGQLASMLPNIVQELEAAGPVLAAQLEAARVESEEQHRRWQEEDRQRREAEARALQEKRRQEARRDLLSAIAAWDEARGIAAYFDEVERAVAQLGSAERQELLARIALARDLLGSSSPLELLMQWKSPDERR